VIATVFSFIDYGGPVVDVRALPVRTLLTAIVAATLVACSGGTDPSSSIHIALSSGTLTIAQGSNGTVDVTLTRSAGFTGGVALSVEGLPTGVVGTFNPSIVTTDASVLTLTVGAAVPVGNTTVTVRGRAAGLPDKTATFTLAVAAAPAGGFTLSVAPTTVTAPQGATGNATVTITRTGAFTGPVSLTATGLPNGVTATFNPSIATGNTSTVTFTAVVTATLGQAPVTIRGNATGLSERTTPVTLAVTAPGNTVFEFCSAGRLPMWLAVQDGATGTWTRVTPTGTRFQFNITQPKAGVAFVASEASGSIASASSGLASRMSAPMERERLMRNRRMPGRSNASAASALVDGYALTIYYGTQAELSGTGGSQCLTGSGKTVNGTVANVNAQQTANITLGSSDGTATGGNTAFQLTDVPDGALDLIAARSTLNTTTFSSVLDKLIIRRTQNVGSNATMPVLDFGASEAFDPVQANITVGNLGGDIAFVASSYFTASGASPAGASLFDGDLASAGPFKYYGVPLAKQIVGDLHQAFVFAFSNGGTGDQARIAGLYFKDPTDRATTLGPILSAATVTAPSTTPYARFRATGPVQAQYNKLINILYTQSTTSVYRTVGITVAEGYLGGSGTYDITVPDFAAAAGWDNNWGPKAATATDWSVTAVGFSGIGFGSGRPVEGSTFAGALRLGTITP
jgi:hypothetical protein